MLNSLTDQEPMFSYDDMRKIEAQNPTLNSSYSSSISSSSSTSTPTPTTWSNSSYGSDIEHAKVERSSGAPLLRKSVDYNKKCPQYPARKFYLALDCEMVGVGINRSSLARVVIIDWKGQVLFDEYIKQSEPVTDYRTFVSGITENDLSEATMPLNVCRKRVSQLLFGHILVGHGLENDLLALGINHPWWMIRDTACYEPFMNNRFNVLMPRKLKDLVYDHLGKEIQEFGKPHSPYEDAKWAMNLYKSVRSDWESCVHYMVQRSVIEASIGRLHIECASRAQTIYHRTH
mmetsp:Transcript_32157/g.75646  ORF Transcript_32157/g.75646 Transcript_32157/m.75646 type:complete len:289 (-) Transcript_32157:124-990(-)